jgi:hypothetical protein
MFYYNEITVLSKHNTYLNDHVRVLNMPMGGYIIAVVTGIKPYIFLTIQLCPVNRPPLKLDQMPSLFSHVMENH